MIQSTLNKLNLILFLTIIFEVTNLLPMEESNSKKQIIIERVIKFAPNLQKSQLEEMRIEQLLPFLLDSLIRQKQENCFGRLETIETLIVFGANATYALELAIENKDLAVARLAINGPKEAEETIRKNKVLEKSSAEELEAKNKARKADVNDVVDNGDTLLIRAIKSQMPEMVDLLITSGADIRKTDKLGRTPIQIANMTEVSMYGDTKIQKLLYAAGIKPEEGRKL